MILDLIDRDNLHHAYLLEGERATLLPEIVQFLKSLPNTELVELNADAFKIEDARNLKEWGAEKSFAGRKFFVISANSILREAQNTLLKLFEEPIPGTHFFLIVPDINALAKTLISRFYVIVSEQGQKLETENSEFIKMPIARRLEFIKNKLAKFEEEEEKIVTDSARADALRFLNSIEITLHKKLSKRVPDIKCFEHIFKIREMLRMPGSSVKQLLESVALIVPVIQ